eukprot:tig00001021_g6298.t1
MLNGWAASRISEFGAVQPAYGYQQHVSPQRPDNSDPEAEFQSYLQRRLPDEDSHALDAYSHDHGMEDVDAPQPPPAWYQPATPQQQTQRHPPFSQAVPHSPQDSMALEGSGNDPVNLLFRVPAAHFGSPCRQELKRKIGDILSPQKRPKSGFNYPSIGSPCGFPCGATASL